MAAPNPKKRQLSELPAEGGDELDVDPKVRVVVQFSPDKIETLAKGMPPFRITDYSKTDPELLDLTHVSFKYNFGNLPINAWREMLPIHTVFPGAVLPAWWQNKAQNQVDGEVLPFLAIPFRNLKAKKIVFLVLDSVATPKQRERQEQEKKEKDTGATDPFAGAEDNADLFG